MAQLEYVSPQEHEAALKRLKALEDSYARLVKSVDTLTSNLEGRPTSNDLGIILGTIQAERQFTDLRIRMLGQAGAQGSSPKPAALDQLQKQIDELSQKLAAALAIAGDVTKIKRTQERHAGLLDDHSGALRDVRGIAEEALRVARGAQTTADAAHQGVADLTPRVAGMERWGTWLHDNFRPGDDGNSPVLSDITTRLDEHDGMLAEVNQGLTQFNTRLKRVEERLFQATNFSFGWLFALLILGGAVGAFIGSFTAHWVIGMLVGGAIGAVIGFAVAAFKGRQRKAKRAKPSQDQSVYRNANPNQKEQVQA